MESASGKKCREWLEKIEHTNVIYNRNEGFSVRQRPSVKQLNPKNQLLALKWKKKTEKEPVEMEAAQSLQSETNLPVYYPDADWFVFFPAQSK